MTPVSGKRIDAILAWRPFIFSGYLHDIDSTANWPIKTRMKAGGKPSEHPMLGIQATKASKIDEFFDAETEYLPGSIPVYGKVSLWGEIQMHDFGYRAEYAYPYALFVRNQDFGFAPVIRKLYLCDVDLSKVK